MENFTNTTIDTTQLPRFEEVQFSKLHPKYWTVILINTCITFLIFGIAIGLVFYFNEEIRDFALYFGIGLGVLVLLTIVFSRIGFNKRGFAFREHDVLFQSGIIATKTIVIPYNRVQHVALHEGMVSRYFGLAKVEVFTAGGSSSDIEIPGIEKKQAENIKQLLMGKIQKQL
ncbi:membrane protein YdbS with pleckstrin-like domain [Flavobacterium arsenatis]|uniref:Membrane protein YdbS with pleckstrin-like domain n=1 Tax=Flavobacterium arsenatis TaxID=1484332 RepID=A0ABU1TTY8_9FLAO|nr:PH domain-containing protein [Flavobacterium arsenatis]MDR6969345.1 membrane protein YdbS with pleckstrin-like domain [Flavobacterium arsenatis]